MYHRGHAWNLCCSLFINSMPSSLNDSEVTMHVNDTYLVCASNSIDEIAKSMSAELENLRKCLH